MKPTDGKGMFFFNFFHVNRNRADLVHVIYLNSHINKRQDGVFTIKYCRQQDNWKNFQVFKKKYFFILQSLNLIAIVMGQKQILSLWHIG